jgi:exodeoxyribonuclease VII small subunit
MTSESAEPQSYAEAAAELDEILTELEAGSVGVDALADRVARAAELIRYCRGRLDAVDLEVERIVTSLGDG